MKKEKSRPKLDKKKGSHEKETIQNSQSKDEIEKTLIKQYEIIVGLADNEMERSWSRFNIFIGLQSATIFGMLVNLNILVLNKIIFRTIVLFLCLLSLLFSLIIFRGLLTQIQLIKVIAFLEDQSSIIFPLVRKSKEYSKLPQYLNNLITVFISIMYFAFWILTLVYLEKNLYYIKV